MGQLEAYGIHEIYLSGLFTGLFLNYWSEENESDMFECFKSYFYSANLYINKKKLKKLKLQNVIVSTPDNGMYHSWTILNLNNSYLEMTKIIDNFSIWQDTSIIDFKVDEHVLKLQQKYNW